MPPDYKKVTKELIDKVGIDPTDIFYYEGVPLEEIFNRYFTFCQENLNIASTQFNIEPGRIFIRNNVSVNAFAMLKQGYYIIGVNSGTIVNLYHFFASKAGLFDGEQLAVLNSLNKLLKEKCDAPIFHLMQQLCAQFTYYHELGHLIQKSKDLPESVSESYMSGGKAFSPQRHVYEFDADIYGATNTAFHIIEFWKKQPSEIKTAQHLVYLASIGVAAIFSYFLKMMEGYIDIYYAETEHPHPLIRILYIVDCFVQNVEGNLKGEVTLKANDLLTLSFLILEVIFESEDVNMINQFVALFWEERENINTYINKSIIALVPGMPKLSYNKVRLLSKKP